MAFQVASELMDWELRDTVEDQLRADSRVLAANAERAGLAQVELPPHPGSGRLVRVIQPDGSGRTPAGQPSLPPVGENAAAVRVAHTRELDVGIADEGGGEIQRLIRSINDMLAALRDSRQAQRLLAEDAAHELKTPLTSASVLMPPSQCLQAVSAS